MTAALITGGTSGIGLATAQVLHEHGWQVIVTGRDPATIDAARGALPPDIAILRADARSLSDADRVADHVRSHAGTLGGLFLNAGITRSATVDAVDEGTYDDVFATNTKGQFFTLQKVLPLLSDGASIVFTVGIGVTRGRPGAAVAAASRGALLAMVPSLAAELAPRRIRVNAVSPGAIDTPIWAKAAGSAEAGAAVAENLAATIPFGRLGTAREVADTVAFLMSDKSAYITGQHIAVAGGL